MIVISELSLTLADCDLPRVLEADPVQAAVQPGSVEVSQTVVPFRECNARRFGEAG